MNDKQEQILHMFYKQHLRPTDISIALVVSKAYVTKIIKTDKNYLREKKKRKIQNNIKHKQQTIDIVRKKRLEQKQLNEFVKQQHIQAVQELSAKSCISNYDYRKWNTSIYNYNPAKQKYVLNTNIKTSCNIPKAVNNHKTLGKYYARPDKITSCSK